MQNLADEMAKDSKENPQEIKFRFSSLYILKFSYHNMFHCEVMFK